MGAGKGGNLEGSDALVNALDEANAQDDLFYYNALPRMPLGVRDSLDAVGPALAMPVIIHLPPLRDDFRIQDSEVIITG